MNAREGIKTQRATRERLDGRVDVLKTMNAREGIKTEADCVGRIGRSR